MDKSTQTKNNKISTEVWAKQLINVKYGETLQTQILHLKAASVIKIWDTTVSFVKIPLKEGIKSLIQQEIKLNCALCLRLK